MKTYKQISFSQISEILMQAAMGVSAVCGYRVVTSDMIYSLSSLGGQRHLWKSGDEKPFYIAIRELGTESGFKEHCIERCKVLGYPLVIAKIVSDKVCDYNMTITFTHGLMNKGKKHMEQEFNSL